MTTTLINNSSGAQSRILSNGLSGYRCHLAVLKEEDDDEGYSVLVLNLPGAGSCGDTIEDAIANAKEAVAGVIEDYEARGQNVPWIDRYEIPECVSHKWVLVKV